MSCSFKARRDGKRVFFLFRRPLWWRLRVEPCNIELFRVRSPYRAQNRGLQWLGDWLVTLVSVPSGVLYLAGRLVKRELARIWPRLAPARFEYTSTSSFTCPSANRSYSRKSPTPANRSQASLP